MVSARVSMIGYDGPRVGRDLWFRLKACSVMATHSWGQKSSWRPSCGSGGRPLKLLRSLSHLHAAATRLAENHGGLTVGTEAARGLERQLMSALVVCLATDPLDKRIAVRVSWIASSS